MYPERHPHPRRRRLTRRRLGVDVLVPADARVDVLVSEVARVDVLVPGVTGMADHITPWPPPLLSCRGVRSTTRS